MNMNMSITNTYPESCFIDYMKALISGDHYQLMPKKIRVRELQTKREKHSFPRRRGLFPDWDREV